MKRGTTAHPKTYTLAAVLDVPIWGAVGILESLWHFAARYAPAGDIGRHSDEAIARGIGWEGNAATLVSGLARAGWVDRCNCHRVRVHDWPDHADLTVKKATDYKFLPCYKDPNAVLPKPDETIATASGKLASEVVHTECIGGSTVDPAVAVAVPFQSLAKATPEPIAPPVPKAWSAEAVDDHRELRGEPSAGKMLSALKPVVERYSWPVVRPVWRQFLAADEGKFGAHNFAANFLALQSKFSHPPARASPSPKAQAKQDAAEALIRGGLIDRRRMETGHGGAGDLPAGSGTNGGDADRSRKRLPGGTG